jgi:hypothetical protein
MPAIDVPPPIWMPARPAIIRPAEATRFRLVVNDGKERDCGACLPRDLAAMPAALRALVPPDEIRPWLPEPFRKLSDGMILSLVANIGGLPGVLMAGGVRTAWLYLATSTFPAPGDWNSGDNAIHAIGAGGNGRDPTESSLNPGQYYGGAGGGGAAWAGLVNAVLTVFQTYSLSVATTVSASTWFDSTSRLLAVGGSSGGSISGGSGSGGAAGDKASCVGNGKSSGTAGQGVSGFNLVISGGNGGNAGGPMGDASATFADAGYGGRIGDFSGFLQQAGQDGIYGPGGGWNAGYSPNVGSGGGAGKGTGTSGSGADPNGHKGGKYGGGGSGAGVTADPFQRLGVGGSFEQGCLLAINNTSL